VTIINKRDERKAKSDIYRVHMYLNLGEANDETALPYIVTIDNIAKEVLSIRRNWAENDPDKKRQNNFVQYDYLSEFDIYGKK
jgi:hypothetical protein